MMAEALFAAVVTLLIWLLIAVSLRREGKRFEQRLDGVNYELRQPKFMVWLGVVCAAFFALPILIAPMTGNETFTLPIAIGCALFAALSGFLTIYALQWKIEVQYNRLIVRLPLRKEREMRIDEITSVRETQSGMIVYINEKRAFDVDRHVIGFELLQAQFYDARKMESVQKQRHFVMRQHKGNLVIGILGTLFFAGCLLWMIFWSNETVAPFVYITLSVFAVLCLYLLIGALRWKLTVSEDSITIQNIVGKEKTYLIQSITQIKLKKESIVLYAEAKKIATVAIGCSNFYILSERLHAEGIKVSENADRR